MTFNNTRPLGVGLLAAACCIGLLLTLPALAKAQLSQPQSVGKKAIKTKVVLVSDQSQKLQKVTPASCSDTCCGGGSSCSNGDGCCSGNCCCEAVCCPKQVTNEVKKHCWKVNSELVCIPGFRFQCNWNKSKSGNACCDTCCGDSCGAGCCDSCPPTCGRVRCINVLEKHEYTCDKCGYEWEAKCVRSSKGRSRCGGCNCPSCGASGCCASTDAAAGDEVQLTSASKATAQPETKKPSLSKRFMNWLK